MSRIMSWLNPYRQRETAAIGRDDADHKRRLMLANQTQRQMETRVGRLESEVDVIVRERRR